LNASKAGDFSSHGEVAEWLKAIIRKAIFESSEDFGKVI
jgi:hypothetical protein